MGKWVIHQRDNGSIIVTYYHLNGSLPPQVCFDSPGFTVEAVMKTITESGPLDKFEWVVVEYPWGKPQSSWYSGTRAMA